MRRVVSLTVTLLRDWIRNREAVFFALMFPILLLVIFSFVFAGGPTEFEVGIQNNDVTASGESTELSGELVSAIEETSALDAEQIDSQQNLSDVDNVEEATGYKRVLVIPDGFDQRVRNESVRVRTAVIQDTINRVEGNVSPDQQQQIDVALSRLNDNGTNGSSPDPVQIGLLTVPDDEGAGAVESIVHSIVAQFNDQSIGIEEPTVSVAAQESGGAGLGAADYFLPAFIVAMILINAVMTVPSAVAQFKRDGTLKRLAASPLRKHEWILANVIQQSILAVVITVVMIGVAWVFFGVSATPGVLAFSLIVLGAIAFTALGMVVGGFIEDPGSAISLGGAIALPLMFISGIFWELDLMPTTLQTVAEFSPVTHFHRSLRQLLIVDSTSGVAPTFGVLAGLAVVFLLGAVVTTDWQEFD